MCICHKSQEVSGSSPYCISAICDQNFWYINGSRSGPALCATAGLPGTGHFNDFNTLGKDIT